MMSSTMFTNWINELKEEVSGRQAYRYADRIAQFHRIQASPGYREAAETVLKLLKRDGVHAELVSYPAKNGNRFLAHRSFQEWRCDHAELWIEGENRERIARFEEEEISIVQRSVATPLDGVEAEVIVIEHAEDPESYKGVDLKGKIALVRGNQFIIHDLAIEKHGAIGLIFENLNEYPPIRTRLDMPDAIQYTSFWWHGDEKKAFGFAVSPRVGEELRARCKNEVVRVSAKVEAKLYDGSFENIEFFIPGKREEEILLVSHLCHPYPGGQDNASGPGTLMETMRSLQRLIQKGRLPQPELGIRFLMMPEMTGTFAYFDQHPERKRSTIAALNLDMVASQSKSGGPLNIEAPPMATPTFVDRFAYHLFELISVDTSNLSKTSKYSTTHFLRTRFSGGSDHYIISDPSIGIPCPMMIQWPDKNYHTTEDSVDNLDPNMMKHVAVTTALYAYGLANGTEHDWMMHLNHDVGTRFTDLQKAVSWIFSQEDLIDEWEDSLHFYIDYEQKSLQTYKEYAQIRGFSQLEEKLAEATEQLEQQVEAVKSWALSKSKIVAVTSTKQEAQKDQLSASWRDKVLKRTFDGPFTLNFELERLPLEERLNWYEYQKEAKPSPGYDVFIQYWLDGQRTCQEVLELVRKETGTYHPNYAEKFIELCVRLGLIR
jgi:aminopeptidase YwaD